MMIDTHSHIFDKSFDEDRALAVDRAVSGGVARLILPAIDSFSHEKLIETARQFPSICYGAMGLHPTSVNDNPDWKNELLLVEKYLAERPVEWVAVGEVGLDLYWSRDYLKEQTAAFVSQIELSIKYDLPLIIHTRDAWDEMMSTIAPYKGRARGVFHSFSGEQRHLDTILSLDSFYIGVGGPVTYKTSTLSGLLADFPLEKILLETDSPYLPPVPYRGKRNESAYLGLIARKIAEIKGVEPGFVKKVTSDNANQLFFS